MASRLDALLELERRGSLPPEFAPALAEARKRGLIGAGGEANAPPPSKSTMQLIKENLFGDDDPNTQNLGERIGSTLNKAGEAMTFGLVGDEASAGLESLMPGVSYDDRLKHYRGQEAVLERDNPGLALGAELGGAVLGAVAAPMAAPTMGAGMAGRMATSAALGGAGGGAYGFMEGEGLQDRAEGAKTGAKWGAAIGGMAAPIAAGAQGIGNRIVGNRAVRQAAKGAPATDELFDASRAAYNDAANAGVEMTPDAAARMREEINRRLLDGTAYSTRPGAQRAMPQTAGLVSDMDDALAQMADGGAVGLPMREVEGFRRQAGGAAGNVAFPSDTAGGAVAKDTIDQFIDSLGDADILPGGDLPAFKSAIQKARKLWRDGSRAKLVDDIMMDGETYRSGTTSGIKNKFAVLLRSPKTKGQFSEAERAQILKVINSDYLADLIGSRLGNMSGAGIGAGLGGAVGGLPGAAIGGGIGTAVGLLSRAAAEKNTLAKAEMVRALLANGGLDALPQASPQIRKISEALMRRTGAAVPQ